jgi:hypothetical protein
MSNQMSQPDFKLPYTTTGYAGQNGRVNLAAPGAGVNTVPNSAGFAHPTAPDQKAATDLTRGNWEETPVSKAFFSPANMNAIQNAIRREVYEKSKEKQWSIGPQDIDELKIIMRALYLRYALNLPDNVQRQVEDLNRTVLDYCVPRLMSEIWAYMAYLDDISHMPVPMERPMSMSSAGSKSMPMTKFL